MKYLLSAAIAGMALLGMACTSGHSDSKAVTSAVAIRPSTSAPCLVEDDIRVNGHCTNYEDLDPSLLPAAQSLTHWCGYPPGAYLLVEDKPHLPTEVLGACSVGTPQP